MADTENMAQISLREIEYYLSHIITDVRLINDDINKDSNSTDELSFLNTYKNTTWMHDPHTYQMLQIMYGAKVSLNVQQYLFNHLYRQLFPAIGLYGNVDLRAVPVEMVDNSLLSPHDQLKLGGNSSIVDVDELKESDKDKNPDIDKFKQIKNTFYFYQTDLKDSETKHVFVSVQLFNNAKIIIPKNKLKALEKEYDHLSKQYNTISANMFRIQRDSADKLYDQQQMSSWDYFKSQTFPKKYKKQKIEQINQYKSELASIQSKMNVNEDKQEEIKQNDLQYADSINRLQNYVGGLKQNWNLQKELNVSV